MQRETEFRGKEKFLFVGCDSFIVDQDNKGTGNERW
jgi:hypothetical protein